MKRGATQKEIDAVVSRIQEFGITPVPLPGAERVAIGTFGSTSRAAAEAVESLPGVAEVVPVSRPFKLASREVIPDDTIVRIGDVPVGHGHPLDRKSTRLNSSHMSISYAVFCLKKKKNNYYLSLLSKKKKKTQVYKQ